MIELTHNEMLSINGGGECSDARKAGCAVKNFIEFVGTCIGIAVFILAPKS